MESRLSTLTPLKRKILGFCTFLFLVQAILAHDIKGNHIRVARAYKNKDKRERQPRQSKFSELGPFGLRVHEGATAKVHGIPFGVIPDAGDTGGKPQTMQSIIKSLQDKRPACYGWYAQASSRVPFDGGQLFEIMDDLKKCKCVFTPAIMPQDGWGGLQYKNNSQAVRIAKVLRQFTDANIPVILRFAHEANWYQHTGQYSGNADDFKEAWDVVSKAVRQECPDCYLHWTPNVDTMEQYRKYAPYNMDESVDLVGFDYYPKSKPSADDFVKKAKEFHDTFAINGRKFAVGEGGLHYAATYKERVDWLTQMASSHDQLPNLVFINWYNSQKEYDYKLAGNGVKTALLTEKLE